MPELHHRPHGSDLTDLHEPTVTSIALATGFSRCEKPVNTRDRFVRTLTGKPVDRVPFMRVFGGTNAVLPRWEEEHPGIGECVDELLGFEGVYRGWGVTPVDMNPRGFGPPETIEETQEIRTQRLGDGTVVQVYKHGDYNRRTIQWPVQTRRDWDTSGICLRVGRFIILVAARKYG